MLKNVIESTNIVVLMYSFKGNCRVFNMFNKFSRFISIFHQFRIFCQFKFWSCWTSLHFYIWQLYNDNYQFISQILFDYLWNKLLKSYFHSMQELISKRFLENVLDVNFYIKFRNLHLKFVNTSHFTLVPPLFFSTKLPF